MDQTRLVLAAGWAISITVSLIAFIAWGQQYQWHLGDMNSYQLFPLLGLLAFSLMWTHYIAGAIRELAGVKAPALRQYFLWTSYAVLICLFLHPGLLIYQLFQDGVGLPPGSYTSYVAPGLGWIATLGSVSLLVFLAFEFHRWFGERSWWHWIADASDVAMLAIIYHGFQLGGTLQQGWFTYVWWFYTITLLAVLVRKYWLRLQHKRPHA